MQIETLTEDERALLSRQTGGSEPASKVLRIIDAQDAALTESRAECERLRAEPGEHPSEPSYETQRAMVEHWRTACDAAESKLAAAEALLVEWLETADEQELNAAPYEGTQAFLAYVQPAAPARTFRRSRTCTPGVEVKPLPVSTDIVEVFVRAPAAEQDAAQTRGASLAFLPFADLERFAPYATRVRRGWGVRW